MGLRQRKKDLTRRAIEQAALACIVENGYEGATMAGIAEAAGVGVGTLYNYFPSKDAMAAGLTREGVIEALRRSKEIIGKGAARPEDAVLSVLGQVLRMMAGFGRPLLREVVGATLRSAGSDLGREMLKADLMVMEELRNRISALETDGHLKDNRSPDETAMQVYSSAMGLLMLWMFDEDLDLHWLLEEVEAVTTILLRGAGE